LEFGGIGGIIGPENSRSGSMKYLIARWASAGFLVAGCWALYFAVASKDNPIEPIVYTLAFITQPIALASFYFHFGIKFYWVLLANTATYALVGLIVETLRQRLNQPK
jgi:hypothetical protein